MRSRVGREHLGASPSVGFGEPGSGLCLPGRHRGGRWFWLWVGAAISCLVTNFGAVVGFALVGPETCGCFPTRCSGRRCDPGSRCRCCSRLQTHHGLWKLMEVAVSSQRRSVGSRGGVCVGCSDPKSISSCQACISLSVRVLALKMCAPGSLCWARVSILEGADGMKKLIHMERCNLGPERCWDLHPWRSSELTGMWPRAAGWAGALQPSPLTGAWAERDVLPAPHLSEHHRPVTHPTW